MLFRSICGFFRSEAKVELDFLLSLKDESFKDCLSDGEHFSDLPRLAQLLGVTFSLYLLIIFLTPILEAHVFTYFPLTFLFLVHVDYFLSKLLINIS